MTLPLNRHSEVDLMHHHVEKMTRHFDRVIQEPRITIDGCTYPADALFIGFNGVASYLRIDEGKIDLTDHLVIQVLRWIPYVDVAYAIVYEPSHQSQRHKMRRDRLRAAGAGLVYISPVTGRHSVQIEATRQIIDPDFILDQIQMIHDLGPAAGIAAARRQIADQWEEQRMQLREAGEPLQVREIEFKNIRQRRDWNSKAPKGDIRGVICNRQAVPYTYTLEPALMEEAELGKAV